MYMSISVEGWARFEYETAAAAEARPRTVRGEDTSEQTWERNAEAVLTLCVKKKRRN